MNSITLAMVGSGGAGVAALGELFLSAAASVGYYGILRKCFGPQIRGGESATIIRLSDSPVSNLCGDMDLIVALDWNNFNRFEDEIPVHPHTQILQDSEAGPLPECLARAARIQTLNFTSAATNAGSSKTNMALLGYLAELIRCSHAPLEKAIRRRLLKLNDEQQAVGFAAVENGRALALANAMPLAWPEVNPPSSPRWIATGNQLAGLGALEAGIRFVAAYPITPASDSMEWMAHHIDAVQGHLVQAEDELSAINMVIGAGYGGTPAMTATSGPGLALMSEAMGLAVASETPAVILNVMRGGPSTGIPTKSEQSDLNLALYGLHGDAPHVVLSALGLEDCFATTAWATQLATELQTLVIVLSDQFIGQAQKIMAPLPKAPFQVDTSSPSEEQLKDYARYRDTHSGISIMATPGDANCMFTADGLEHSEAAVPSPKTSDHQRQLDKRARKLEQHAFGEFGMEKHGDADDASLTLVCWGSLYPIAKEARQTLLEQGFSVNLLALRQLMPLPAGLPEALDSGTPTLVIEQNHQGQLSQYLQSQGYSIPEAHRFAKPGPSLITPREIVSRVQQVLEAEHS